MVHLASFIIFLTILWCPPLIAEGQYTSVVGDQLARFCASPSPENWSALQRLVEARPEHSASKIVAHFLDYNKARERRDLPNSMALQGRTPNEFVAEQSRIIDDKLRALSEAQDEQLWRLLKGMAAQNFDESLVWTAAEIAYRVSPSHFEIIAAQIGHAHAEKAGIFAETEQKWSHQSRS